MLRINAIYDSAAAESYYTSELGAIGDGYYLDGQEASLSHEKARWHGQLAARLGLDGEVLPEQFKQLWKNTNPLSNSNLTELNIEGRRVGYDLTFNAVKSASLVYGLTGDAKIMQAFRDAIAFTAAEIEKDMHVRVRQGGQNKDRKTANMAAAEIVHLTARPVENQVDMHLHAHLVVFNASWDEKEKKYKAGQFHNIKRDGVYFESIFHNKMAENLIKAGYGIERQAGGSGWEISGISKSLRNRFSRRTALIEQIAKSEGITSAKALSELGKKTRKDKMKNVPYSQLQQQWWGRLSEEEIHTVKTVKANRILKDIRPENALAFASEYHFERQSVVGKRQLMATALKHGMGSFSLEALQTAMKDNKTLIHQTKDGEEFVTHRAVLQEELAMIRMAQQGRNTRRPLNANYTIENQRLGADQGAAVRQILESSDKVMIMTGKAGVGKTTTLKELARGIQKGGRQTFTFAPSTEARNVLRENGFTDAETFQQLLKNPILQHKVTCGQGSVLVVDESSLIGTREMKKLLDMVQGTPSRILLVGDPAQHAGVLRGDAFRILLKEGHLPAASLVNIRRQSGGYREAVEQLSEGNMPGGLKKLQELGFICEIPDAKERYRALAADYIQAAKDRKSCLIIAPQHQECEQVNLHVREALKANGLLKGKEQTLTVLKPLHLTEAEKGIAENYLPGAVIQMVNHGKGEFRKSRRFTVQSVSKTGMVMVQDAAGQTLALPLQQADKFAVFQPEALQLAIGDKVRITQNIQDANGKRLHNGAEFLVLGFGKDSIQLQGGHELPKDIGHLKYAYAQTSHAVQGKTVARVLIAESGLSYGAASQQQLYVSASRGKQSMRCYVDDAEEFKKAVLRNAQRQSATELIPPQHTARQAISGHLQNMAQLNQLKRTRTVRRERLFIHHQGNVYNASTGELR